MLVKPLDVIDRTREWEELTGLWERPGADLALVVGRRRVGKSYLLARFAKAVGGVYYQATRRTEAEQLAALSRVLGEQFDELALKQGAGFTSWEELFEYLAGHAGDDTLVVVFDEFPYLSDAAPALTSIVQKHWDHRRSESRLKLVLSGSYLTAMKRLEAADQPLYGRRTARFVYAPFGVVEARGFLPGWSAKDVLVAYGTFGQLPGHLSLLEPERSLAENIERQLLSPSGRLVDDAQHVLDAFSADAAVHYSILEAVATGQTTWSGITDRVGRSGGALSRPIEWLLGMGLLERVVPITEKNPNRSKKAVYRLTDPYLTFWHRVIAPLIHTGSIGLVPAANLWREVVAKKIDDHMGSVFEEICREFVRREARASELRLPFRPVRVGNWWDAQLREEVDVVALGSEGQLLVGEAKWGPVNKRHLDKLRRRAELVANALGHVSEVHLALFTGEAKVNAATLKDAERTGTILLTATDLIGRS